MHRLPLLLCVIALLGSSVSAALFFRIGNSKQRLEQQLGDAQARLGESQARVSKLDADLASAHDQKGELRSQLHRAEATVAHTEAALKTAETRVVQTDRDLAQTRSVLEFYEQTARTLADEITALRQDLEESRTSNASPAAVAAYRTTISELERQLAATGTGAAAPRGPAASTAVFTNRAGRATILTIGPESAFVVLNFGAVRGAQVGQKLSVSHGTAEVATVLISDVRPNFSIAHVLPETLRGVLQKGDSALLLR